MNGPLFVLVHLFHVYENLLFYIFEIMIHFYPNLVVKLAKIIPKMVVKNDFIFGKTPLPRHNLKTPLPLSRWRHLWTTTYCTF